MTNLALLRGINLGGKNKIPMKDLAGFFTQAGCSRVLTYIQSGNVIFRADARTLKRLPDRITEQILERFGYRIPVVLRTSEELADAIANNPFLTPDAQENRLFMMFLADLPDKNSLAALDPDRSPTDEFFVRGREIYMYLRTGAAGTKLTNAWFDKKLGTVSTARNWRTTLKLNELLIQN
ncbi:MAG: hypothetical protein QOJ99_5899 [Bryobacterales bacterium]|jgi:uncharacterized protein (DUF1697 family)|nr:hypothetical protein [Bryobacterales bacterium]